MRNSTILFALFSSLVVGATACTALECPETTIERDGVCQPMDNSPGIVCGPFTELQGDRCVPMFPPTECDPSTTVPIVDPETGVVTCVGGNDGSCLLPLACPPGSTATKLTVCGQIYDFEDNAEFQDPDAGLKLCNPAAPTTSGPCALQIAAYDAQVFATNPATAPKLPVGNVYIDDCGRYRVTDIDVNGTSPFIGLGFDDASMPIGAPGGLTATVGVATTKPSERYVRNFEAWVVKPSTAGMWEASGGPPLSGGIYASVFRAHKKDNGNQLITQSGVTITKNGNAQPANDHYFAAAELTHQTIDTNAAMTGANGTGLYTGALVTDSVTYSGQGGLGAGCRWELHAAASLPGIVFIQVYRKIDVPGMTCND